MMDLMDAVQLLAGYYEPPCTPHEVVVEVRGELSHEEIDELVVADEITNAKVALAFHAVIDASDGDLQDAVEELSCGVRN
jgi:hypothetical protein